MLKEYKTVSEIYGPLMLVESVDGGKYGHIVDIEIADGTTRHGQILQVEKDKVLVQVFEGTEGINVSDSTVCFLGKPMELAVSPEILGRVFDGTGNPKDGGPAIIPKKSLNINGNPINPYARDYPNEFIQTGISTIDGLNPLVRGQKLPIFSARGCRMTRLPCNWPARRRCAARARRLRWCLRLWASPSRPPSSSSMT